MEEYKTHLEIRKGAKSLTLGTKSLLFGGHQFLIHPLLVLIAWVKLYKSFPSWREAVCIFIHDWGYWGVVDLKGAEGDKHPEYGANIADRCLGKEWKEFILGHSSFYIARNGVGRSRLLGPDKYWHCIIPLWAYKLLTVPSGEFKYYRSIKHARQVTGPNEPDSVWYKKLQEVCRKKVDNDYFIDTKKLSK